MPLLAEQPENPVTFQDAIQLILDRSPAIQIQKASRDGVESRNLSSRLSLLPTISGQLQQSESGLAGERNTRRGALANAELNLFKFGADNAAMRAATSESETQEALLSDTILQAEEEAVKAIVAYLQARFEFETISEIKNIREEALSIAQERFHRGVLPLQEAEKFSIDLNNAKARLADTQSAVIATTSELEAMLGHHAVSLTWPWKELLKEEPSLLSRASLERLKTRPDWLAGMHRVEAARQRKNQALGVVFPSLDFSLNYGIFQTELPTGSPSISAAEWKAIVSLSVPLFDRLENFGQYRALVHAETRAEAELEKVRRHARIEFDTAKGNLAVAIETAKLRDKTLTTAKKLYRDNLARFRKGLISANELIIDQERLTDSQLNAIRGWAQAHLSFSRLCHALGDRLSTCLTNSQSR